MHLYQLQKVFDKKLNFTCYDSKTPIHTTFWNGSRKLNSDGVFCFRALRITTLQTSSKVGVVENRDCLKPNTVGAKIASKLSDSIAFFSGIVWFGFIKRNSAAINLPNIDRISVEYMQSKGCNKIAKNNISIKKL